MNVHRIQKMFNWLTAQTNQPCWTTIPFVQSTIRDAKNELIWISQDIAKEEPYLSSELFNLKDDHLLEWAH